jgi:glucosamine--fructose-6-phosphate aminotransferase (isomerizing)
MSSLLYSEIVEQPTVIRRLLDLEAEHMMSVGQSLAKQDIRYVILAARGTSDNAARYGQYVFGALNRLVVAQASPSLASVYRRPPRVDGALVIGISQSGQSPDIVSVLEEARRQGAPTIALTNDPRSPLAAAADHVLELHAGEERSIAATKTYTAQLAAVALLSMCMTGELPHLDALRTIPSLMEQALRSEPEASAAAERIAHSDRCAVVGRGFNYATTFEIGLKIKELAYVEAEPYSSADFRHGPIAMVEPGFPVILVTVGEAMQEELVGLRESLRQQGAKMVVLGDDESIRHPDDAWIPVPARVSEWLTPLVAIVPGQLLAYHLALARGGDPDRPRTLHKVTRTR